MSSRSTPAIVVMAANRLHLLFFSILCVPASGTLIADFSCSPLALYPVTLATSLRNGFKIRTLAMESPIISVNHICKRIRPPTARPLWSVVSDVSQWPPKRSHAVPLYEMEQKLEISEPTLPIGPPSLSCIPLSSLSQFRSVLHPPSNENDVSSPPDHRTLRRFARMVFNPPHLRSCSPRLMNHSRLPSHCVHVREDR